MGGRSYLWYMTHDPSHYEFHHFFYVTQLKLETARFFEAEKTQAPSAPPKKLLICWCADRKLGVGFIAPSYEGICWVTPQLYVVSSLFLSNGNSFWFGPSRNQVTTFPCSKNEASSRFGPPNLRCVTLWPLETNGIWAPKFEVQRWECNLHDQPTKEDLSSFFSKRTCYEHLSKSWLVTGSHKIAELIETL